MVPVETRKKAYGQLFSLCLYTYRFPNEDFKKEDGDTKNHTMNNTICGAVLEAVTTKEWVLP